MTQWVSLRALGEAVSAREAPPLCALARGEAQADTARGAGGGGGASAKVQTHGLSLPHHPRLIRPLSTGILAFGDSLEMRWWQERNKCGCHILWHQHHQSARLGPGTPELLFVW